jgi:hypothetical protein
MVNVCQQITNVLVVVIAATAIFTMGGTGHLPAIQKSQTLAQFVDNFNTILSIKSHETTSATNVKTWQLKATVEVNEDAWEAEFLALYGVPTSVPTGNNFKRVCLATELELMTALPVVDYSCDVKCCEHLQTGATIAQVPHYANLQIDTATDPIHMCFHMTNLEMDLYLDLSDTVRARAPPYQVGRRTKGTEPDPKRQMEHSDAPNTPTLYTVCSKVASNHMRSLGTPFVAEPEVLQIADDAKKAVCKAGVVSNMMSKLYSEIKTPDVNPGNYFETGPGKTSVNGISTTSLSMSDVNAARLDVGYTFIVNGETYTITKITLGQQDNDDMEVYSEIEYTPESPSVFDKTRVIFDHTVATTTTVLTTVTTVTTVTTSTTSTRLNCLTHHECDDNGNKYNSTQDCDDGCTDETCCKTIDNCRQYTCDGAATPTTDDCDIDTNHPNQTTCTALKCCKLCGENYVCDSDSYLNSWAAQVACPGGTCTNDHCCLTSTNTTTEYGATTDEQRVSCDDLDYKGDNMDEYVDIDWFFGASSLDKTIKYGQKVRWTIKDSMPHPIKSTQADMDARTTTIIDSSGTPMASQGDVYIWDPTTHPGVEDMTSHLDIRGWDFPYVCQTQGHESMTGTITIEPCEVQGQGRQRREYTTKAVDATKEVDGSGSGSGDEFRPGLLFAPVTLTKTDAGMSEEDFLARLHRFGTAQVQRQLLAEFGSNWMETLYTHLGGTSHVGFQFTNVANMDTQIAACEDELGGDIDTLLATAITDWYAATKTLIDVEIPLSNVQKEGGDGLLTVAEALLGVNVFKDGAQIESQHDAWTGLATSSAHLFNALAGVMGKLRPHVKTVGAGPLLVHLMNQHPESDSDSGRRKRDGRVAQRQYQMMLENALQPALNALSPATEVGGGCDRLPSAGLAAEMSSFYNAGKRVAGFSQTFGSAADLVLEDSTLEADKSVISMSGEGGVMPSLMHAGMDASTLLPFGRASTASDSCNRLCKTTSRLWFPTQVLTASIAVWLLINTYYAQASEATKTPFRGYLWVLFCLVLMMTCAFMFTLCWSLYKMTLPIHSCGFNGAGNLAGSNFRFLYHDSLNLLHVDEIDHNDQGVEYEQVSGFWWLVAATSGQFFILLWAIIFSIVSVWGNSSGFGMYNPMTGVQMSNGFSKLMF